MRALPEWSVESGEDREDAFRIRSICPEDNEAMAGIIVTVLAEFGCVGPGWASGDPELRDLCGHYRGSGRGYWVVTGPGERVLGGGGFARLKGTAGEEGLCELQKVYFLPELRGRGLGRRLLEMILEAATAAGYREMYLESIPELAQAVKLYQAYGFRELPGHRGNTGHQHTCTLFMSKALRA